MEKEEGEMSDDNGMVVDDDAPKPAPVVSTASEEVAVLYKAEKNGIVVAKLEKVDAAKLEERANRFGLSLTGHRLITQKQIDELYNKAGIESGNERHFRFDTLHLYGIEGLTTREIFEYLEDYKPVSLEKVDERSCNIVCQDHITAALALLMHSREIRNEDLKNILSEQSHHHWREGMPHPKNDLILMRFATNSDKKLGKRKHLPTKRPPESFDQSMDPISKNPWGDLCRSWGVYDHQEVFQPRLPTHDYEDDIEVEERVQIRNKKLAMRLGKRRQIPESEESSDSDTQWKKKSKAPRMRMHADDEESKRKLRKPVNQEESDDEYDSRSRDVDRDAFAPLSIEVVNSKSSYTPKITTKLSDKFKRHSLSNVVVPKDLSNIQSRLGVKVIQSRVEQPLSDDYSSDDSDDNTMSRVQPVSSSKSTSSVWSRLDSKRNTTSNNKDLRQMLKTKNQRSLDDPRAQKQTNPDDLRARISQSKKATLRIEIDNS